MSISHAELLHELQHVKLGKRLLGYDRKAVTMLLEQLATSYEDVPDKLARLEAVSRELAEATAERDELRGRVSELDDHSDTTRELAQLVQDTLAAAQRASDELRAAAAREAEEIRSNAVTDAARTVDAARSESRAIAQRNQLHEECQQLCDELRQFEEELAPAPDAAPTPA